MLLLFNRLPPPRSTLFPYTTLFRSRKPGKMAAARKAVKERGCGRPKEVAELAPSLSWMEMPRGDDQRYHHRSEEHTSELQSRVDLVCRLLLEKKKKQKQRLDSHTT